MADATFSEGRQFDFDSGGGTDYVEISGIVFAASGGGLVAGGIATIADALSGTSLNSLNTTSLLTAFNGTTWDRVRTVDAEKTASANPDAGTLGVTLADRRFTALTLGTVIGNTQTWDPIGSVMGRVHVATSTTGTFTFEVSSDGSNWIAATVWDVVTETDVSATNLTPTANKVYRVSVNGYRSLRARTVATLGATVALTASFASAVETVFPQGNQASGVTDAGNPLKIGGRAQSTAPTAVTDGQRVNAWYGLRGQTVATLADISGNLLLGQGTMAASIPVTFASNQSALSVDSELPAAAALADATANPTVPGVGAFLVGYNGTTWDRVRTANTGRLQVDVITGGGGTPANVLVDNAGFTDGTSSVGTAGFIFDEVAGTALTENDVAAARIDAKRAQVLVMEDATTRGQRLAISASGRASVDLTAINGTAAAALADAASNLTTLRVGADLMLFNGTTWDRARGTSAGGQFVQGNVASDVAITGNPLLAGARGSLAVPTAVGADGRSVALWTDRTGRLTMKQSAGTATLSNVASSATNVTVLAANTGRLGATVFNDSTQVLFLKFGATASSTSYTVRMVSLSYYEVPVGYTGILDGIWASANGSARVTEIS